MKLGIHRTTIIDGTTDVAGPSSGPSRSRSRPDGGVSSLQALELDGAPSRAPDIELYATATAVPNEIGNGAGQLASVLDRAASSHRNANAIGPLTPAGTRAAAATARKDAAASCRSTVKMLTRTIGIPGGKARGIADEMGSEALNIHGARLDERLKGLDRQGKRWLQSQIHYSSRDDDRISREDRLSCRAAVLLAFAKGASRVQIETLRTTLDTAVPGLRQATLQLLQAPGPYREVKFGVIDENTRAALLQPLDEAIERTRPPEGDRDPKFAEQISMRDDFRTPKPGYDDFCLTVGGRIAALARIARQQEIGYEPGPVTCIRNLLCHPEARGLGTVMLEKAAEISSERDGKPCIGLRPGSLKLHDHYRQKYGFALLSGAREFEETSASREMTVQPAASGNWRHVRGNQYAVVPAAPPALFTFPPDEAEQAAAPAVGR